MTIEIIGLKNIPLIKKGDNISTLILNSLQEDNLELNNGDIILIAETIISKSEGNIVKLDTITPSKKAYEISEKTGKNPKVVELIIQESNEIIKIGPNFIISETKHGFVCANAGVDESNITNGLAKPLPENPDKSASEIRKELESETGKEIGVIITDTQGRAFRFGAVGTSIGCSGLNPIWKRVGDKDLYGRELETTEIGTADELASAASLIQGQADEGLPIVLIRGFEGFGKLRSVEGSIESLLLPKEMDVFRK